MPILSNAKKALRSSQNKAQVNQKIRSKVKNTRKKVEAEPTQENLQAAYTAIDKAVKKGVFHSNKGARLKSQVAKIVATKKK
jgi:small subunit ribosomal protein S20